MFRSVHEKMSKKDEMIRKMKDEDKDTKGNTMTSPFRLGYTIRSNLEAMPFTRGTTIAFH